MSRRAVVAVLLGVFTLLSTRPASAQPAPLGDPLDLTLQVSTDQLVYDEGEPVEITKSICNETAETIRYSFFPSADEPYLEILDVAGHTVAFAQADGVGGAGITREYDPGECSFFVYTWFQTSGRFDHLDDPLGPPLPPGTYRAQAPTNLGPAGVVQTVSAPFRIGELLPAAPGPGPIGLLALGAALALGALFVLRR